MYILFYVIFSPETQVMFKKKSKGRSLRKRFEDDEIEDDINML
jgi:hypothetical protein